MADRPNWLIPPQPIDARDSVENGERLCTDGGADPGHPENEFPVEDARSHPVLLFDGVCNLCNRWVQFVIERDSTAAFRFAPLQSAAAQELLSHVGYSGESLDSVVLVEDGEYYTKSTAAIRTARHLDGPLQQVGPLRFVPRRVRDTVYDFVANRRYRWFGRRDQCMRPEPDLQERFLETTAPAGTDSE